MKNSLDEEDRIRKGYERYELVRTLNPCDFTALWKRNVAGEGAFDDLVDKMIEERKQK